MMIKNVMTYQDYFCTICYSTDDEVFFGRIEGIQDSITFEGTSVKELKESFIEAVEDYLEMCKNLGKEPQKPYKGSFNIRINPELHKQLAIKAIKENTTLNNLVEEGIKLIINV